MNLIDLDDGNTLRRFAKVIGGFRMPPDLIRLAREARVPKPYLITTPAQLKKQLLSSSWRLNPSQFGIPANSQVFGRLVRDAEIDGILYRSARGPGQCIALFADKLTLSDSYVELADPAPRDVRLARLDRNTCLESL